MEHSGVKIPYSVLLLFTAPGSFSCNLKKETKGEGNPKRENWRVAVRKTGHIYLLGHCCVDLSAH